MITARTKQAVHLLREKNVCIFIRIIYYLFYLLSLRSIIINMITARTKQAVHLLREKNVCIYIYIYIYNKNPYMVDNYQ